MSIRDNLLIAFLLIFTIVLLASCAPARKSEKINCKNISLNDASPIDEYRLEFACAVDKFWKAPKDIKQIDDSIHTSVLIKILPDGSIDDIKILEESGSKALDESAIRSIKLTNPFKPFPQNITEPYILLGIRFQNKGVR